MPFTPGRSNRQAWPPTKLSEFRKLWDSTARIEDIGKRFGIQPNAVRWRARQMKLKHRAPDVRVAYTFPGPWQRRCPCHSIFTTSDIDERWCEACR